jgi:CBS domain-containing protein
MNPRTLSELALDHPPLLRLTDSIGEAIAVLLEADLPALPVVDERDRLAGIFGEREFMGALFPGYLGELKHAAFVRHSLDDALERRESCRDETLERHVNREHVEVGRDFSDAEVAEIFLHHRVLVIPIVDDRHVVAMITRHAFFRAVAERFAGRS